MCCRQLKLLGFGAVVFGLTACTGFTQKNAEVYRYLANGNPQSALLELEKTGYWHRDRVLYDLNKGMLLRMIGDFSGSNELFESAKQEMQGLSATSITENIAAVTINETSRSYVGQPYEQLLLYAYKTLNYLALSDIDDARVEVLQADAKIREWISEAKWEGVDASVFIRYLSGIVFELSGEWSEALIAYRRAYEVLQKKSVQIPYYLQLDLLRLTRHLGLKGEYDQYLEMFPSISATEIPSMREQGEVILIFHQGLVSRLFEQSITNFSPDIHQHLRISVPVYPLQAPWIGYAQLQVADQVQRTDILENIDRLARENFAARSPGIAARAMLRVVAKKAAAKSANDQDALAGFIVDLAGLITEQADTRSWTSLPASIQIARINLPPGEYRVQVMPATNAKGIGGFGVERMISLAPKQKVVVSVHDIVN